MIVTIEDNDKLTMSRFFSADFHLGGSVLLDKKVVKGAVRPFNNSEDMKNYLLNECNSRMKETDVLIHIGDFASYGKERGIEQNRTDPFDYIKHINAKIILLEGNHDRNNKVNCDCKSLVTTLGPYHFVTIGHFPSWYSEAFKTYRKFSIHLCGHVHGEWKWKFDETNGVLNINCGIDVWKYHIVKESKLIGYIGNVIKQIKNEKFKSEITKTFLEYMN